MVQSNTSLGYGNSISEWDPYGKGALPLAGTTGADWLAWEPNS